MERQQVLPPVLRADVDFQRDQTKGFGLFGMPAEVVGRDAAFLVHRVEKQRQHVAVHGLRYVMMLKGEKRDIGFQLVL